MKTISTEGAAPATVCYVCKRSLKELGMMAVVWQYGLMPPSLVHKPDCLGFLIDGFSYPWAEAWWFLSGSFDVANIANRTGWPNPATIKQRIEEIEDVVTGLYLKLSARRRKEIVGMIDVCP